MFFSVQPRGGAAVAAAAGALIYIAAIARTNGLVVATRDTSSFEAANVQVINPWGVEMTDDEANTRS